LRIVSFIFCSFGIDKRGEEDALKASENLGHRIMWLWISNAGAELCGSQLVSDDTRRQLKIKIECARSCYDLPFDRTCAWLALVKKSVHATLTLMFDASPDLMQNWEAHALLQNEVPTPRTPHALVVSYELAHFARRIAVPLCWGFFWQLNPIEYETIRVKCAGMLHILS
jgi:hypothetical protein